jgi:tRNA A-37 threonylcarbamoyl transferase component Bud32
VRVALPGGAAWVDRAVAEAQSLTVERVASGLAALPAPTHRFKADDRSEVFAVDWLDKPWVTKRIFATGLRRLLHPIYRALKLSPVWRERRGEQRLRAAGLRTATALAIVHDGRGEVLVLPRCEGESLDRFKPSGETAGLRYQLARTIGRQVGRMTAAGLVNRDYKASNLIVDEACWSGGEQPIVIDTAGVKTRRGDEPVFKMLAVLLRSTRLHRPVSNREALAAMREVLRTDGTLLRGEKRRLRRAVEAIARYPDQG